MTSSIRTLHSFDPKCVSRNRARLEARWCRWHRLPNGTTDSEPVARRSRRLRGAGVVFEREARALPAAAHRRLAPKRRGEQTEARWLVTSPTFISLALALAAGLLIGLEREQSRPAIETRRAFLGGIRTFPIIALTGAVSVLLAKEVGPWALVVAGLGVSSLLVVVHWRDE